MIEVSIAHDKAFNSLSDFAQLLFLKILPHTDDYGRFEGDPDIVKARVDPLSKKNRSRYEQAMHEISRSGLWAWYRTDTGRLVVQYKPASFQRINAFLIKNRGNEEFPEFKEGYETISSDMPAYHIDSNKQKAESNKQQAERAPAPTEKEVIDFFASHGFPESLARRAYSGYAEADWHDSRGKKILNWKQKMIQVWFKDENKTTNNGAVFDFKQQQKEQRRKEFLTKQ
jgi:hypothetical protein